MESPLEKIGIEPTETTEEVVLPISSYYMYEYGHKGAKKGGGFWFTRNYFLEGKERDDFRLHYNNEGIYRSAFAYDPNTIDNVSVYDSKLMGDFYMDFDHDEDVELARKDALQAIFFMSQSYGYNLPLEAFHIFFSGKKGFHIIIPHEYFGYEPDASLHEIFRAMAVEIKEFCTYETLDMAVYEKRRVLRMENSVHEKTGLHKIPLTYDELKDLDGKGISALAQNNFRLNYKTPYIVHKASTIFKAFAHSIHSVVYNEYTGPKTPLDFTPSCIQHLIDQGPVAGGRNNTMAVLSSFYKSKGLGIEEIEKELMNWVAPSLTGKDPVRVSELRATMKSVVNSRFSYGCSKIREIAPCEGASCRLYRDPSEKERR